MPNRIQISAATRLHIHEHFQLEPHGCVDIIASPAGAILVALVCAASTYTGAGIRFTGAQSSKLAPSLFAARVGADVPPIIELHALPDHVLASNPETKLYKFTKVDDQVVLVDPTNMRVIAVIDSKAKD
jgi:hypothetical protein